MKNLSLILASFILCYSASAFSGLLPEKRWERAKAECASGELPRLNEWRMFLEFYSKNSYTITKTYENHTTFELGDYREPGFNQVCLTKTDPSSAPEKCFDYYYEGDDLRLGELMTSQHGPCENGDYFIQYFTPMK